MIFYFSGTGNTRWAAQQLASATGEKLYYIPDEMKQNGVYELAEGERLGFCFPTHGWQPPRIVREFIARSTFLTKPSTFVYALTTHGDNMGKAMDILNEELAAKGLRTQSVYSLTMPETYVCLPFMVTDTPQREREKIAAAEKQLAVIAEEIKRRERGVERLVKGATPRLYSYVIGAYFNKHMITDKKFMVDADLCVRCGKCSEVCPVDNIAGTPPTWLHNGKCTCCLACYHYCPTHAINYGERTKKRGQYYFKANKHEGRKS